MLDENYYQISGWMMNRLHLKGVSLNVYAIIYGFTQDGETEFKGSVQYLCDACGGVSRPTILAALKELVSNGYLIKSVEIVNNVRIIGYKVSLKVIREMYTGYKENLHDSNSVPCKESLQDEKNLNRRYKESLQGDRKNLYRGYKDSLHNNNIDNNNHNNIDNNNTTDFQKKSAIKTEINAEFEQIWKLYPRKEEKKRALSAYVKARTKKDNPCTFEQVLAGVERYRKHTANKESQYIKTGATWFNGECWNDEYSAPTATDKTDDPDIEKYKCLINKF